MIFIDVSANNPHPIDWAAVKGAGVDGVIIKATEGTSYVNPDFGRDYFDAAGAGLRVGAYHFWHPELDWSAQVHYLWDHYGPRQGDFPPVWDAEVNPTNRPWSDLAAELHSILDANAGRYGDAWGYWNRSWNAQLDQFGASWGHGVWLATGRTGPTARAVAQQFAPTNIPGISGLTDWSAA